jgi:hypothetical protein
VLVRHHRRTVSGVVSYPALLEHLGTLAYGGGVVAALAAVGPSTLVLDDRGVFHAHDSCPGATGGRDAVFTLSCVAQLRERCLLCRSWSASPLGQALEFVSVASEMLAPPRSWATLSRLRMFAADPLVEAPVRVPGWWDLLVDPVESWVAHASQEATSRSADWDDQVLVEALCVSSIDHPRASLQFVDWVLDVSCAPLFDLPTVAGRRTWRSALNRRVHQDRTPILVASHTPTLLACGTPAERVVDLITAVSGFYHHGAVVHLPPASLTGLGTTPNVAVAPLSSCDTDDVVRWAVSLWSSAPARGLVCALDAARKLLADRPARPCPPRSARP